MFTKQEKRLARLGYCYHARENRSGLRPLVKDLNGKTRVDVIFDNEAFKTHKESL